MRGFVFRRIGNKAYKYAFPIYHLRIVFSKRTPIARSVSFCKRFCLVAQSWWMRARISGFILSSCRVASGQTVSSIRSNLPLIISCDCVVPRESCQMCALPGGGWRA